MKHQTDISGVRNCENGVARYFGWGKNGLVDYNYFFAPSRRNDPPLTYLISRRTRPRSVKKLFFYLCILVLISFGKWDLEPFSLLRWAQKARSKQIS